MFPYAQIGIFPDTINTACRRSKRSTKKNILSVANVVTFERTSKFLGTEYQRKWCKERTRWMRSKAFPVRVDDMARCSFSINLCAPSFSCCCTIVTNSPSLMIMFSFVPRFCTSSSLSHCSSKVSWSSLEMISSPWSCSDLKRTRCRIWARRKTWSWVMASLSLWCNSKRKTERINWWRKNSGPCHQLGQGRLCFSFSVSSLCTIFFDIPYPRTWMSSQK